MAMKSVHIPLERSAIIVKFRKAGLDNGLYPDVKFSVEFSARTPSPRL